MGDNCAVGSQMCPGLSQQVEPLLHLHLQLRRDSLDQAHGNLYRPHPHRPGRVSRDSARSEVDDLNCRYRRHSPHLDKVGGITNRTHGCSICLFSSQLLSYRRLHPIYSQVM